MKNHSSKSILLQFKLIFLIFMVVTNVTTSFASTTCTRPRSLQAYPQLKISIFYGYIDQRPNDNTLDHTKSLEILNQLTSPCIENDRVTCGFQLVDSSETNKWTLSKWNHNQKIEILLVASSLSDSDDWNQHQPEQLRISDRNQSLFMQEILYSDILIYQGHSRYGFGPDFHPPRLSPSGETDKKFYMNTAGEKNIHRLLENLSYRAGRLPALGLFSCESQKHFQKQLKQINNTEFTLLTSQISFSSQLQKPMLQFIDNILRQDCLEKKIVL